MSKLRPSPATALAFLALLVALGGSAMAEPVVRAARDLVTREEIAPNAVRYRHIGPRQVAGRHVRSRTLTLRTLTRGAINALRRAAPRGIDGVAAGGDLTGTYPNPRLRAGSVGTLELANLAVTAPKLAANAVTATQLANNSVTNAKLADDAVATAELADDAVTTAELADGAVTTDKLLDGAVLLADLAVASVDSARVVDESLQAIDLGPDSVGSSEVVNNSLTAGDLGPDSVATQELADNTVTDADLASSSVGQSELQPFSVTPQKLASAFPAARVSRLAINGEQVIEPNQAEALSFFTARFEKGGGFIHDNSNPTRLTAPIAGTYLVSASVTWQTDPTGRRELFLRHQGNRPIAVDTETASSDVSSPFQTVTTVWHLAAGEYVEALVQQTNTGNDNLTISITSGGANTSPEFSLVYLGP